MYLVYFSGAISAKDHINVYLFHDGRCFAMIMKFDKYLRTAYITFPSVTNDANEKIGSLYCWKSLGGFFGSISRADCSLNRISEIFPLSFSRFPQLMSGSPQKYSERSNYYSCDSGDSSGVSINKSKNTNEITQKDVTDAKILLVLFFIAITMCIWATIVEIWY